MWWAVISGLQIGYGDVSVASMGGRVLASIYFFFFFVMLAYPLNFLMTNSLRKAYNEPHPMEIINRNIPSPLPRAAAIIHKLDRLALYLERIHYHAGRVEEKLKQRI